MRRPSSRPPQGTGRNGLRPAFTLIELVVVMILLSIMGSVVVPTFLRAATVSTATAMSTPIVQLLRFAQRSAAARDRSVVVTLDPATARYRAVVTGDDTALVAGTLRFPIAVRLVTDSLRARFVFAPDGSEYGDSLGIVASEMAAMIHVDPWTGAVSVHQR